MVQKIEILNYKLSIDIIQKYSDIILDYVIATNTFLTIRNEIVINDTRIVFPKFQFKKRTRLKHFIQYLDNILEQYREYTNE